MTGEIRIAAPLAHQEPLVYSPASRKVARAGRRWGKTRAALFCAVVGHGPVKGDEPLHRGIVHGYTVYWIARDFGQSDALWTEEIKPRFDKQPAVKVNNTDRYVELPNAGRLAIQSAENIASIRGAGAKLIGVIIDEAAWQDLEDELRAVVLPMLLDNSGWLLLISTTNAGKDGNSAGRVPSYFNIISEEIEQGKRSAEWQEFYGTPFDNPKLSPAAIDELIAEYPQNSVELAQEIYAKRVTGGAGVAFPEWSEDAHVADYPIPHDWRWAMGGDYGYVKGWVGLFASGPQRSICRWEWGFAGKDPYQFGYELGSHLQPWPLPEWISIDTPPVPDGGPTILEEIQRGLKDVLKRHAPPVVNPPKGPGSRVTGKLLVHRMLRFTRLPDGGLKPWLMPELQYHPSCRLAITSIPKLPLSPKDTNDVDTLAYDEPYDGTRAWIMSRIPQVGRRKPEREQDRHVPHGYSFDKDDSDIPAPRFQRVPVHVTTDDTGDWE